MGDEEEVVDSAYTLHVASTYTWQRSLLVAKWREGKLGKRKKREGAKYGKTPSSPITTTRSTPRHLEARGSRACRPPPTVDGQCDDNETGAGGE